MIKLWILEYQDNLDDDRDIFDAKILKLFLDKSNKLLTVYHFFFKEVPVGKTLIVFLCKKYIFSKLNYYLNFNLNGPTFRCFISRV